MNYLSWSSTIIICSDVLKIKQSSELCFKRRVPMLLVTSDLIERATIERARAQSKHHIITSINVKDQKNPGIPKLSGLPVHVFDSDGFEIAPIMDKSHGVVFTDLTVCSDFLKNNLNNRIIIGWDMQNHALDGNSLAAFLQAVQNSGSLKPSYIRFSSSDVQKTNAIMAKMLSLKTATPYDAEVDSDYKTITAAEAFKQHEAEIKAVDAKIEAEIEATDTQNA